MPANVVRTLAEEKKWEKAKELADEAGRKDDYAYVMGIFKKMNPERFKEGSLRVVARYLLKRAYEAGHIEPVGWGFVPGEVEENSFTGEGSIFPPHRDGRGDALENLGEIPTDGLTPMLSQNRAPKTARRGF